MQDIVKDFAQRAFKNTTHVQAYGYNGQLQVSFRRAGALELEDWGISVDQPALVQFDLSRKSSRIALSDPLHSLDLESIQLTLNKKITPGVYSYQTQGLEVSHVKEQEIIVQSTNQGSKILVKLPDENDSKFYAHREALYAGMPAAVEIPSK
jgi:hypothetical protein